MSKFQYLITVSPLGLMYGSAGAFLSPKNLVGRAGSKFPPDTAAIAGLFFNANREQKFAAHKELRDNLVVSGPFWAKQDTPNKFYVPIPWHQVIAEEEDGLFLENAVQLHEDFCLVYLSNYEIPSGWYRFGGEGHLVEVESHPLSEKHKINRLLRQKIQHAFALIAPGVWGSNKLSYRYPCHPSFPRQGLKLLTDKAVPYRYRLGDSKKDEDAEGESDRYDPRKTGRLSRGRYAVPSGSVYVFKHPLNLTWWEFPDEWFPKEGFRLKHLGCGLCLPIDIQEMPPCTAEPTE